MWVTPSAQLPKSKALERVTVLALLGLTAERRTERVLRQANRAMNPRLWGPC